MGKLALQLPENRSTHVDRITGFVNHMRPFGLAFEEAQRSRFRVRFFLFVFKRDWNRGRRETSFVE